jgi:outer membrane autotransporter protein
VRQRGYTESGNPDGITSSDAVTTNTITTTLGLNFEREFQNQYDPERRIRLFAKIGWEAEPVRSHSSCMLRIANLMPSSATFENGGRSSAVAVIGFRNRLSKKFELSGGLHGRVNGKRSYISVNASIGYTF